MPIPTINMLNFCRSGEFGGLKLGQTKAHLAAYFPPPDSVYPEEPGAECVIWRYGSIDLIFRGDELTNIYADGFPWGKLDAGSHIAIQPWIFKHPKKLRLAFVIKKLNFHGIDFRKKTFALNTRLLLTSGVELYFENQNTPNNCDANKFVLTAFNLGATPKDWAD